MDSDDLMQTKAVRYSGSTEQHTIQFSEERQILYLFYGFKYIIEIYLDICVLDNGARAVIVVNQTGKLRFTYIGPFSTIEEPFDPRSITTGSHSRILIAGYCNHCTHILHQNWQFLRIRNCDSQLSSRLCINARGILYVYVCCKSEVKKIQHL